MSEKSAYTILRPKKKRQNERVALLVVFRQTQYMSDCICSLKMQSCKNFNLYIAYDEQCHTPFEQECNRLLNCSEAAVPENVCREERTDSFFSQLSAEKRKDDKHDKRIPLNNRNSEEGKEKRKVEKEDEAPESFKKVEYRCFPASKSSSAWINEFACSMQEDFLVILDGNNALDSEHSLSIIYKNIRTMPTSTPCIFMQGWDCNYQMYAKSASIGPILENALSSPPRKMAEKILLDLNPILLFGIFRKSFFLQLGGFAPDLPEPNGLEVILHLLSRKIPFGYSKTPVIKFRDNGFTGYEMIFDYQNYEYHLQNVQTILKTYVWSADSIFSGWEKYLAAFRFERLSMWKQYGLYKKMAFIIKYFPIIFARKICKYLNKTGENKISVLENFILACFSALAAFLQGIAFGSTISLTCIVLCVYFTVAGCYELLRYILTA